jgi:hypothetical protein
MDSIPKWCLNKTGDTFLQSLAQETGRGQILMAAALLENLLADCLRAKFRQCGGNDTAINATLGNSDGREAPASSFSAKIDICRALGIINNDSHKTLHQVRNSFAHSDFKIRLEDVPQPSKRHHINKDMEKCASAFDAVMEYLELQEAKASIQTDGTPVLDQDGKKLVGWQWMLETHEITPVNTHSNQYQFLGAVAYLYIRILANRFAIDGHQGDFKVRV